MAGGIASDPKASKPSLKNRPVPVVYMETQPTELIVVNGEPNYEPIPGTQLLYVKNTTGRVFKDIANQNTYVLIAGRWFSAPDRPGPGSTSRREPAAGLREDPRREPDGEREGLGAGDDAGAGGRHRQQHPADGDRQAHGADVKPITFDGAAAVEAGRGHARSSTSSTRRRRSS